MTPNREQPNFAWCKRQNIVPGAIIAGCVATIAFICFLFVENGDDYFFIVQAQKFSPYANCREMFCNWGLRSGSVFAFLTAEVSGRWLFALLNTAFFTLLAFLTWRFAGINNKPRNITTAMLTCLLLMYGAGRARDLFFWRSGATTYMWTMALTLAFFAFFIREKDPAAPSAKRNWLAVVPLFILGGICGMSNENNCPGGLLVFAFLLWQHWKKRLPVSPALWAGIAGFITGILLLVGSPGTKLRYATEISPAVSLFDRIAFLPEITLFWGFSSLPALVVIALCTCILIRRHPLKILFRERQLQTVWLIMGCSLLMAWAFAAAHPPAMRAYFSCFVLNVIAAVRIFAYTSEQDSLLLRLIPAGVGIFIAAQVIPAYSDVIQIRKDENFRRTEVAELHRAGVKNAELSAHTVRRKHLLHYVFVEDITADPEFFVNQKAAGYYGFDSVRSRENYRTATFWRNSPHE